MVKYNFIIDLLFFLKKDRIISSKICFKQRKDTILERKKEKQHYFTEEESEQLSEGISIIHTV